MNFDRFTERARRVIVLAQEEARSSHNYRIGTPHILLGLLREEGGMAATILRDEFCMEKKDVRPIIRQGDALVGGEEIPLETQAEKALELAIREALILGCSWVGTEHILLGLSRAPGEISELLERRCGGAGFAETIRLEVVERLRGPKEEPDIEDTEQASAEAEHKAQVLLNMELRDVLGDVLTGFKMWRDRKVSDMSLDNDDEAFIRWLEAGSASDYLD